MTEQSPVSDEAVDSRATVGLNHVVFQCGDSNSDRRLGIYMKGSCDLPATFLARPMIEEVFDGTCCILREGLAADSRSDILLQTLNEDRGEEVSLVSRRLNLPPNFFRPTLFESTFLAPSASGEADEYPKHVVIISIAPDVIRGAYRHREHDLIVDPGGWWLNQSVGQVLSDPKRLDWFQNTFESIGRISVDQFYDNYATLIQKIKHETGAEILVFNTLTIEPGSKVHNLQFIRKPYSNRRREFNLALVELSREYDISVVDIDGLIKTEGIDESQMDFGHFPAHKYGVVANEVFRILRDRNVFDALS